MKENLQKIEQKYGRYIPYVLVAIIFIVKWIFFPERDLHHDEPWCVILSIQTTVGHVIAATFVGNPGILFEVLLHFWIKIGGMDLEWMRTLPLIISAIGAFFIYKIAKHFGGILVGFVAVLMYALSSYMNYYGFEVRMYSLYATLSLASTWFMFQYLNEENKSKKTTLYYILWGFSTLCLVYTHWFSWIFVGFQFLLAFCYFKTLQKKIALLFSFVVLGFAPVLIKFIIKFFYLLSRFELEGGFVNAPSLNRFYNTFSEFFNDTRGFAVIAAVVCVVAFILAIKQKNKKFQLLCLSIGLPFTVFYLICFVYPMWVPRYVIFACVGFILIYAISLIKIYNVLKSKWGKTTWLVFAIFLTGFYLSSFDYYKRLIYFDLSGAVEYIRKHEEKPFVFATTNYDGGIVYTYHQPILKSVFANREYDDFYFTFFWDDEHLQTIRDLDYDQVIIFGNRLFDEDIIPFLDSLAKDYPYQKTEFFAPFNHVRIYQKNEFSEN
jgi:hypothetical protein